MKSIMHKKDGTCYLCVRNLGNYYEQKPLHEHHVVFGGFGAGRKASEKYGLKVYLCIGHHLEWPNAVHKSYATKILLCEDAQRAFEREYPTLSFREIFGKNYLDEAESTKSANFTKCEGTFELIEDGINDNDW